MGKKEVVRANSEMSKSIKESSPERENFLKMMDLTVHLGSKKNFGVQNMSNKKTFF
jgi:hypothetical protein